MDLLEICRIAVLSYQEQTDSTAELEYTVECISKEQSVVSIRGTEGNGIIDILTKGGWLDIIRDLRFIPRYYPGLGWCHGGFLSGAVRLFKTMHRPPKDSEIIFTGHSLGAAVSLLLAQLYELDGYRVKWVGFGCPKPFIGSRELHFTALSVVNGKDIVATLPRGWIFNFQLNATHTLTIGDRKLSNHASSSYYSSMLLHPKNTMEI